MKNYPEYPDNYDVAIKILADECGIRDFDRAKAIYDLVGQLRRYAIQDDRFVRECLSWQMGAGGPLQRRAVGVSP